MTDGLAGVATGSAAYHQRLLAKGARLEAAARLDDLVKVNLVDARGDLYQRRYSIHALTRTFLHEQVLRWV